MWLLYPRRTQQVLPVPTLVAWMADTAFCWHRLRAKSSTWVRHGTDRRKWMVDNCCNPNNVRTKDEEQKKASKSMTIVKHDTCVERENSRLSHSVIMFSSMSLEIEHIHYRNNLCIDFVAKWILSEKFPIWKKHHNLGGIRDYDQLPKKEQIATFLRPIIINKHFDKFLKKKNFAKIEIIKGEQMKANRGKERNSRRSSYTFPCAHKP